LMYYFTPQRMIGIVILRNMPHYPKWLAATIYLRKVMQEITVYCTVAAINRSALK
jgi:hypothetical protein